MKKLTALLLLLTLLLSMGACAAQQPEETKTTEPTVKTVGICLPDRSVARWENDGMKMTERFTDLGYRVMLEFAEGDEQIQLTQVERLIGMPVDCLIVAAVDSLALSDALSLAKTAGIPVIAYDRLILQTDALSVCVALDYYATGVELANHLVLQKQLQTAAAEQRSYTVEFFMGSPDDHNAMLLHQGLMQVLQPYLDKGVLISNSGRVAFEDTYIQFWDAEAAQTKCANYLSSYYTEAMPDILLAASDELAAGLCEALWLAQCPQESWPYICGLGAGETAVERLVAREQTTSVYRNIDALRDECIAIALSLLAGQTPELTTVCHNGVTDVPVSLHATTVIDANNYTAVLGYSVDGPVDPPHQEDPQPDTVIPEPDATHPETELPLPNQKETEPEITPDIG